MADLDRTQQEAIARLVWATDRLESGVARLSERELDYSVAAGQWTIRQIVHHLVDGCIIWTMVFNRALAMPEKAIRLSDGFPGNEAWANLLAFDKRPIQAALNLVVSDHRFLAEAASHFPDRWERYVTIPDPEGKEVRMSAGQIITMLGEHLVEHVAAIEEIKRAHPI